MADVELRLLTGRPQEISDLQRVFESSPGYSRLVTGSPAGPSDAQTACSILPPGKCPADKFFFGVYTEGRMVGCIDIIRGYPEPDTAHVGLLLISEQHQGRGLGRSAFVALEKYLSQWEHCARLRLGVVTVNARGMSFWKKLGFEATGEVKPYRDGSIEAAVVLLERRVEIADHHR